MAMRVAIIGGGITGLAAARLLRAQQIAVTLIDRGFPFGGRLRSERVDIPGFGRATFDPGPVILGPARYKGCKDAPVGLPPVPLQPVLFPAAEGVLRTIPVAHFGTGVEPDDSIPEVVTTVAGGAQSLIENLLPRGYDEYLGILTNTEVMSLETAGLGWRIRTRETDGSTCDSDAMGTVFADAILLTQPVPEALGLLDHSGVELSDAIRDDLGPIQYTHGLALMAAFQGPNRMPPDGLVAFSDSPLTWLIDNHCIGASPVGTTLTALADPMWARDHWGEPDDVIAKRLLPLVGSWAEGERLWYGVRRWEYHQPTQRVRMPFTEGLDSPPLVVAGDAFAGYVANPLDAAYTSATHAVSHLCRSLGRIARSRSRSRQALKTPSRITLEVSVSSPDEAADAVAGGADRLFLSAAPEVGGLTPTLDTFLGVRRAANAQAGQGAAEIPITVLLRPRLGGCDYAAGEFDQMRRDARRLLASGANGIAFGVLSNRGGDIRVDAARCQRLVRMAHSRGREAVFHRAFDWISDRRVGLQDLLAIECDRVVTSGGRRLAIDGLSELETMVCYAGWDIEIVAAGGITPETVGCVVSGSRSRHVLAGLRRPGWDQPASAKVVLGRVVGAAGYRVMDLNLVAATEAVLRGIDLAPSRQGKRPHFVTGELAGSDPLSPHSLPVNRIRWENFD